MARGYPDLLRRIHAEGHVIGTHSETHPLAFDKMAPAAVRAEIEAGFASTTQALGVPNGVAPFFRIPGLRRADNVESYLRVRRTTVWSADVTGDDWRHISAAEVVARVMRRLNERGKGIILLHDIQPATALALPELLRQLKKGGYRIVQVAPASRGEPAVAIAPKAQESRESKVQEPKTAKIRTPVATASPPPAVAAAAPPSPATESVALVKPLPPEITRPLTSTLKPSHKKM
jgi:peptidoglycan-N-acetylglucosamine deacetylase